MLTCRSAEAPESVPGPVGVAIHRAGSSELGDLARVVGTGFFDGTSTAGSVPRDIEAMCRKLLANTVIENFRIERPETAA